MEKIIVLNFETAEVFVFPYDTGRYKDAEDFFIDCEDTFGIKLKSINCQWMIAKDMNIQIQ